MTSTQQIAEAFSGHRFTETYEHFADDIQWRPVGGGDVMTGREAVRAACEGAGAEMATMTTEFLRFVSVGGPSVAAVDAVGRYTDADGGVSVVTSCDIYEFDDEGLLAVITSYAVELEADSVEAFLTR